MSGVYFERLKRQKQERTWYFAFFKSSQYSLPAWMRWCMRDNYTHVLAFSQVDNYVQVVDPVQCNIEVSIRIHPLGREHFLHADFIALDFMVRGADVVKIVYDVDATPTSHTLPNFFPGCVTIAKGLLGISEWIFTPWQFYQWLLENRGELLTEERLDMLYEAWFGHRLTPDERCNIFRQLRRNSPMVSRHNNAAKQQEQLLMQEQQRAQKQANVLAAENKRKSDAAYRQRLGRSSLINTSELGVQDTLG
jgi:hypothetical protein